MEMITIGFIDQVKRDLVITQLFDILSVCLFVMQLQVNVSPIHYGTYK